MYKKEIKLICPKCKKEMTRYSDFGVTNINGILCAIIVAGNCDCNKPMTVKYPIDINKAFV